VACSGLRRAGDGRGRATHKKEDEPPVARAFFNQPVTETPQTSCLARKFGRLQPAQSVYRHQLNVVFGLINKERLLLLLVLLLLI
jgi:hypothetical protein